MTLIAGVDSSTQSVKVVIREAESGALMQEHLDAGGMIIAAVHDPLPNPARPFEVTP